ncbi:hypothetical protein SAMN04488587_0620 [Methanococcoides vulcani]|uniref:DUF5667 domain-containing protein n=1 Tax=Methanococcoides vulcani TaxID=1353158 RepID=A0A1H9YJN8_9EURY|nr:DUF5667 domain-containing protein [Methanococcoides vulcani]SES69255.1 hypothetical protein SAMN04488587_0620 [Methanococcoides vulcani]
MRTIIRFFIFMLLTVAAVSTASCYPVTENTIETDDTSIDAGITPNSQLYFLDKATDNINLALTFDQDEKAKKGLNIARERLLETREMINENNVEGAQIARSGHEDVMNAVQSSVGEIEQDDSMEEIEDEIIIDKEVEEHITEIEDVIEETKIKIEIKGDLTSQQQELINSLLADMRRSAAEVEIEIENEKEKTKIKLKEETQKSDEEIDDEIQRIESDVGVFELHDRRMNDMQSKAQEHISALEKNVNCGLLPSSVVIPVDVSEYSEETELSPNETLQLAWDILNDSETKDNWEDAKDTAELAKDLADKVNQKYGRGIGFWSNNEECPAAEEESDEDEDEEEIDIEVEVKDDKAEVKIKINKSKDEFILNTTNMEEIISEIKNRTSLTDEQIDQYMEFEIEEDDEDGEESDEVETEELHEEGDEVKDEEEKD